MTITARTVLAAIQAIPETPENYRQLREATRAAEALAKSEDRK